MERVYSEIILGLLIIGLSVFLKIRISKLNLKQPNKAAEIFVVILMVAGILFVAAGALRGSVVYMDYMKTLTGG